MPRFLRWSSCIAITSALALLVLVQSTHRKLTLKQQFKLSHRNISNTLKERNDDPFIRKHFAPRQTRSERRLLLRLLRHFHNVCQQNGLPYFIHGGAALAFIRCQFNNDKTAMKKHGTRSILAPWDDDIDVVIDPRRWREYERAFLNANNSDEFVMKHFVEPKLAGHYQAAKMKLFHATLSQPVANTGWRYPHVDVPFAYLIRHADIDIDKAFPSPFAIRSAPSQRVVAADFRDFRPFPVAFEYDDVSGANTVDAYLSLHNVDILYPAALTEACVSDWSHRYSYPAYYETCRHLERVQRVYSCAHPPPEII